MRDISRDVLSACMFDSENMAIAIERGVTGAWFDHVGVIFEDVRAVYNKEKWDKRTSTNIFEKENIFVRHAAAADITSDIPDCAFRIEEMRGAIDALAKDYARRVIKTAAQSALFKVSDGIDPYDVGDALVDEIKNMKNTDSTEDGSAKTVAKEAFEIDKKIASGVRLGLPFPWIPLQQRTHGIPHGSVSPLTGRDGVSKSRLVTFLAEYWGGLGIPILYLAFEDSKHRFMSNLAGSHGKYDLFDLKKHYVPTEYMDNHRRCLEAVGKLPIIVHDKFTTVEGAVDLMIRADRRFKEEGYEGGLEGVVVDGLKDLILSDGDGTTGKEEHINSRLVGAARALNVAIVPISHLTDIEEDKWIARRNIRGSKKQSQSARQVMIVQDAGFPGWVREKYPLIDEGKTIIFQVAKCSYGEKGLVALNVELERGRFVEIPEV